MRDPDLIAALRRLGLDPQPDAPLSRHGYWRIGGPADALVDVGTPATLAAVLALGAPVTVLGNGSNLLVADAGVRGVTLRLTGEFRDADFDQDTVIAGAGLQNAVLLRRAERAGVGGLAPLAGVPGTVGGAIRLTAGTARGEIGDRVLAVELATPADGLRWVPAADLRFAYRSATLPASAVVTRARLRVTREGMADEAAAIAHHLARRKATPPLDQPSCGSVVKNPPGDYAGRLIEAAGLKGAGRGGARISDKHANFIVNEGQATAADVLALIRLARDTVRERLGVSLDPEVHAAGDWDPSDWPLT